MDLKLAQLSYPVSDVERAVGFFEGKLGLKLMLRPHAHMAFFDLGGGIAMMVERADDLRAGSILYLACDDVAQATAELQAKGIEIVSPPHRITEQPTYDLWMSFFKEPDGRLMALHMTAPKGWRPS
ncbi:MAG TPA: VOC family protein [Caulobacteraceae bacterium]|jgi:predicted enzyme related to lactoylglutathione lyase